MTGVPAPAPRPAASPTIEWARELAAALVDAAKKAGGDHADAAVGLGSALSASARDGAIEDVTRSTSRSAGVRVIVGGRLGFATSADAPQTGAEVAELARTAVELARLSTPSDHNVLPAPQSSSSSRGDHEALERELLLWDDDTAVLPPAWAIEQALAMERVLAATAGITLVKDVSASVRRGAFALASSTGFSGSYRGTSCTLACSAVVDDDGKKQSDGYYSTARGVGALLPAEHVAREAARRALARKGARRIASTRAPVIFDPMMARGFFAAVLQAACGDALARRQSFLLGKKGAVLFPAGLSLVDDARLPGGFASRPFDGEGLVAQRLAVIDDSGRLASHLHDARSAARMREAPTGHAARSASSLPSPAPTNTTLVGGSGDLASIVRDTPRGLLVTRLLGRGPDMASGDYSRGAAGFWIEGGEIAHPVDEVTVAGTMLDMMRTIDRVGADLDVRAALRTPTIRFAELSIGGK